MRPTYLQNHAPDLFYKFPCDILEKGCQNHKQELREVGIVTRSCLQVLFNCTRGTVGKLSGALICDRSGKTKVAASRMFPMQEHSHRQETATKTAVCFVTSHRTPYLPASPGDVR